jgi:hypothetical protein
MGGEKVERGPSLGEFPGAGDRQARVAKHPLGVGTIIFQAVAVRAAADDVESLAPQLVLQLAAVLRDVLEQNDSILAGRTNPIELAAPIGRLLHQPGERAAGERVADRDLDLVPFLHQSKIKRAEIAVVADTEKAHRSAIQPGSVAMPPCCRAPRG